ncbi:hypothetical protein DID88_004763 [Monilinia fructigena]|uniref:tRNA synthetases class I catalytic domain-containing protein n=1 Tax=Monilinia fructigena TaxID=38457 RepID=A0A395IRK6_9HELO|nr:hypothetical protein DID88_004763 [Monilinia fructigena]
MEDMDALNVIRPDVITRVTTYVPKIAIFVEKIIQKGFAYESDGSVYFDIAAFEKAGNLMHDCDQKAEMTKLYKKKEKGHYQRIWVVSEEQEILLFGRSQKLESQAGPVHGVKMDIHSGGIDLAFPHHDNELAQSEAYFCQHEHGRMRSKMSKSLKNFQTIRDALATDYTPRSMRIVFLMGRWNDGVEISPDMRLMADGWEGTVNNFFVNVKSLIIEAGNSTSVEDLKSLSIHPELQTALDKAEADIQIALTESFDTPRAMLILQELIKESNVHIGSHKSDLDIKGLEKIARWVTKIVGIFGLDANATAPYEGLGWASTSVDSNHTPEQIVAPYSQVFKQTRWSRLTHQIHSKRGTPCTKRREIGQGKGKTAQKEAAKVAREKLEQERLEKAKLNPVDMFKDDRFIAWDSDGIPTKTKDAEDVPKSALKKLKKDWERQKKAHEEWKAKAQS